MIERQEIHCHACDKWVQFKIDLELNGNHVLKCPNCQHEHCRVVKDGHITDIHWDQRNGPTWHVQYGSYTAMPIYVTTQNYYTMSTGSSSSIIADYMSGLWQSAGTTS
jgi:hypothetical protein